MNYQGQPCKQCNETITLYSRSGFCRQCFHNRRKPEKPFKPTETTKQHFQHLIEAHRSDLTSYHILTENNHHIPEHRYIYEQTYGAIPRHWIIHHLNGMKGDNRLENLLAMPRQKHNSQLVNRALKERIIHLENKLGEK